MMNKSKPEVVMLTATYSKAMKLVPGEYPEGTTREEMIAILVKQVDDEPFYFIESANCVVKAEEINEYD